MFFDRAAQVFAVQMGVYLRRQNTFVAQHFLHLADTRAPFQQMRRKRVAEGVGAYVFVDARPPGRLFDDREDHHARQLPASVVQKYGVFLLVFVVEVAAVFQPAADFLAGRRAHRYQPLFVSFADYTDVAFAEKEVRHAQGRQFRGAQAARVEHFQHRAVAATLGGRRVDGRYDAVDFFGRQYVRQLAAEFGRRDEFRRRGLDFFFQQQEVEEAPDAAQAAGLRRLAASALVEQALYLIQI